MSVYFENDKFDNKSFKDEKIVDSEYQYCTFMGCDFSNASILSSNFIDCEFRDCNLTMLNLEGTILNNVRFYNCKIMGVRFNQCNSFIFQVYFSDSILDYSSFEGFKVQKTLFLNSSLKGVDFTNTNLKQTRFDNCNLDESVFIGTNLQETNFETAYNYTIDLDSNFVKKTRFSKDGLAGLLRNYDIIVEDI